MCACVYISLITDDDVPPQHCPLHAIYRMYIYGIYLGNPGMDPACPLSTIPLLRRTRGDAEARTSRLHFTSVAQSSRYPP